MKAKFLWTCPYCRFTNSIVSDDTRTKLLYCDAEEGGCDKMSVVALGIDTYTVVKKVEGELEYLKAEREKTE